MHSNASFKYLNNVNIVSQLDIVRYEINIDYWFVLDFFQKYKKVSQNIRTHCPPTNSNDLANVMRL